MARDGSKIYFSERGEIACGEHAPYPGSDTFRFDGWRVVTPAIAKAWADEANRTGLVSPEMKCETCGALPLFDCVRAAIRASESSADRALRALNLARDAAGMPPVDRDLREIR